MAINLNKPTIGTTAWGTDVNNNWSVIEQLLLAGPNLCLNPGFELLLYFNSGHTAAITQLSGANSTKNSCLPGWIIFNKNGTTAPLTTVIQDSTHKDSSAYSAKITATTGGTGGGGAYEQGIRQTWGGTDNGVSQYLDEYAYQVRGRVLNFAVDLKLSGNGVTAKIRIDDGSTTTEVSHTGTTDWTRKLVTHTVAATATQIKLEIFLNAPSTNDYLYADNCMVVATDAPLDAVPFMPRPPVKIVAPWNDFDNNADWTWGATAIPSLQKSDNGTYFPTTFNPNAVRPHWANRIEFFSFLTPGAAHSIYATIAPYGSTNGQWVSGSYTAASAYTFGWGVVWLGQDGLLSAHNYNDADCYGGIMLKGWEGEGL